jgi:hypothetical protein
LRLRRWHWFDGLRRFLFPFQPDDFRFEGNEPFGKLLNAILCANGAHNQPDCQRNRNSENYQDDKNNTGFHKCFLSTDDTTWLRAVCAPPPVRGKRQKQRALAAKSG